MTATESLVNRLPTDMGGFAAGPIQRVEHELEPWEKRCHALADVLDKADGGGQLQPLAAFMTNPAGAAIVNATGPI
jgi:hypothetical protein